MLRRGGWALASVGICVGLSACATYQPMPLDESPHIAPNLAALRTEADGRKVDIAHPLTLGDIVFLALENNLDLQAQRADHNVAEAQLIQAGILPNPSVTGSYGVLLGGPDTFDAWSVGLTEDIKALITMSAKREGAKYELRQVDAEMVWAEWELVSKVALLVVDVVEGDQKARLLERTRGILDDLNSRAQRAYAQGNLDVSAVAPLSAALSGVDKDSADLAREQQSRHNDLNAFLGLAPGVSFPIDPTINLQPVAAEEVQKLLPDVTHRRPDLVALQLGYHSQEAKVRAAILGQFPSLVFGGSYAVDTAHVRTAGPSIAMDLPIFDRNQGQIAIEQATRQKLHDEFTSRLAAATTEIDASLAEDDLIERQLKVLQAALPGATKIEQAGASAYRAGNINGQSYVDLVSTRLSKEEDINALQQLLLESRIKIAGLLGIGIPSVTFPAYEEPKR
jgi:outer membrane protein TolC